MVSGSSIYRTGPGTGCPTGSASRTYGACNSNGVTLNGIIRGTDGLLHYVDGVNSGGMLRAVSAHVAGK
jgi:hypothetical protein